MAHILCKRNEFGFGGNKAPYLEKAPFWQREYTNHGEYASNHA